MSHNNSATAVKRRDSRARLTNLGRLDTSLANGIEDESPIDGTPTVFPSGSPNKRKKPQHTQQEDQEEQESHHTSVESAGSSASANWSWANTSAANTPFSETFDVSPHESMLDGPSSATSATTQRANGISPTVSGRSGSRASFANGSYFPSSSQPVQPGTCQTSSSSYTSSPVTAPSGWSIWPPSGESSSSHTSLTGPTLGHTSKSLKGRRKGSMSPASPFNSTFRSSRPWSVESSTSYWRRTPRPIRWLLCLIIFISLMLGVRHRWPRRKKAPAKINIPAQIWHGGKACPKSCFILKLIGQQVPEL